MTETPDQPSQPAGTATSPPPAAEPTGRLAAVALGIAIAAGVVFIVAAIFFSGFALGCSNRHGGHYGARGMNFPGSGSRPGSASAAPLSGDFSNLTVDPNVVTDSTAFSAATTVLDPDGQPGVSTIYAHRDGTRQITNNVLVLPDTASATSTISGFQAGLGGKIANAKSQPAAAGTGGTLVSGKSRDGTKSVTVLTFTERNTATEIEFDGPANDPAPNDLVTQYGQQQDSAIKTQLMSGQ